MKYCPSCGKQWVNEAKFCVHCGFNRLFANGGKKDRNKEESKEENYVSQDNESSNTEKEVIQNSISDRISEITTEKNTYELSLIKEKKKKNPQSTSKQMNFFKKKKFILISSVFLLILGISSILLIANNSKPKLSDQEKKEALETYKAYKETKEYIKEHGYEDELATGGNSQNETTNLETASEESSVQGNINTNEMESTENSSTVENTEDTESDDSIIAGKWYYPEMKQVYEINFIDDFNGMLKIKSQEGLEDLSFRVTNFIDDNLEISIENGEVWNLNRGGIELNIWKDNGVNMILNKESGKY